MKQITDDKHTNKNKQKDKLRNNKKNTHIRTETTRHAQTTNK